MSYDQKPRWQTTTSEKNEALVVKGKAYISDADKAEQFAKSFSRIPVGKNDRKLRRYVRKTLKPGKPTTNPANNPSPNMNCSISSEQDLLTKQPERIKSHTR